MFLHTKKNSNHCCSGFAQRAAALSYFLLHTSIRTIFQAQYNSYKKTDSRTRPKIIAIENIWFNGFFNTVFSRPEFEKRKAAHLSPQMACRQKLALSELLMQSPGEEGPISVSQCRCFETFCAKNGYALNHQFPGQIVQQTCKTREEMRKNEDRKSVV